MRKAAQIAGAAAIAAMLLTGCGSGGDTGGGNDSKPTKSPDAPATPDKPADAGAVEGAWKGGSAGSPQVLVISKGTVAFSNGHKAACLGKVQQMAGMTMAALKCTDGDTTRTMGTLKAGADGKTLTVDWKNGPTEKYTKSSDGSVKIPDMPQLPSGVPTS
ncbi:hypothetical protein AB0G60_23345 [Streptomyces angustmyceticus]|uniref:Lipoprotein n=1 Tax=Streptomyces angustmyceticus TaxID=285578 RepID=A0A5J4LLL9_9ACTN|nr:hypothetical protein [Streptomyces angustmyceticus]UAL68507.1 hypothetical protein K7396_19930 [Streptomyces angustmyceticus]GES32922.1 hypothetical protein San01_54100 [Streptomyces angustmyceticus]